MALALLHIWRRHAGALVDGCLVPLGAAQAATRAPGTEEARHLAVVVAVLARHGIAAGTAGAKLHLLHDAVLHLTLLEATPKAV